MSELLCSGTVCDMLCRSISRERIGKILEFLRKPRKKYDFRHFCNFNNELRDSNTYSQIFF
jgi:hypothetical protein